MLMFTMKHTTLRRVTACLLLLTLTGVHPCIAQDVDDTPGIGKYFVAVNGNDEWSGSLPEPRAGTMDGPFATIDRALKEHRKGTIRSTIFVRGGTYHLAEPISLLPSDSGLKILAYKSEQPILSGGKAISGWKRSQNPNIWTTTIPEARGGRWPMRLLRVGNELQTLARNPNADTNRISTGAWSFTVAPQKTAGAFGAFVSKIHNKGDWIEWTINVTTPGDHRLWLLYSAVGNRALGIADLSDRMQVQVNGGPPILLKNLPDGLAPRWASVATVPLNQGSQIIRWTNVEGGYINLDALLFSGDPAWDPNNRATRPARPVVTVQAEAFVNSMCKEMVTPQGASPAFRDRFQFDLKDFKQYRSPQTEVHIFPGNGPANEILALTRVDIASRTAYVDARVNAEMEIKPGSRYFVANALEDLDAPGEWYLDPSGGNLYLWPAAANFERLGVVAAALDHLIEFKGDAARNEWVDEVQIKGFQFSDTLYSRVLPGVATPSDAAIWISGARRCVIERNQFVNLGGHAVRVEGASTANEIVGNRMTDLGQGGVLLTGDTTTQPRDTLIAGNWMQRLGLVHAHVGAVVCRGATGTKVQHNRIERVPRFAIAFHSYDARISSHNNIAEYNDIQFACAATSGSGAIEVTGRHKQDTRNVIQFNRILDTLGLGAAEDGSLKSPHLAAGVYLDEFASGVTVRGNILARAPLGGVVINGGGNNSIENNIFVDGLAQQVLFTVADTTCEKNRLVKNIFSYSSPNGALYKHIGQWRPQVLAEADGNIFWHAQGATYFTAAPTTPLGDLGRWKATGIEINSVVATPGFIDPTRDNYQLQPASAALARGFQPVPVENIGLAGFARSWK